jgi:hypothetical protein
MKRLTSGGRSTLGSSIADASREPDPSGEVARSLPLGGTVTDKPPGAQISQPRDRSVVERLDEETCRFLA